MGYRGPTGDNGWGMTGGAMSSDRAYSGDLQGTSGGREGFRRNSPRPMNPGRAHLPDCLPAGNVFGPRPRALRAGPNAEEGAQLVPRAQALVGKGFEEIRQALRLDDGVDE